MIQNLDSKALALVCSGQFDQFDLNVRASGAGGLVPLTVEPDGVPARRGRASLVHENFGLVS